MNREFLIGLVAYIVDVVRDDTGSEPLFTKVVKLVYLIDVEYYRSFGRTLSGLQWRFHHYGPWDEAIYSTLQPRLRGIEPREVITPKGKGTTWRVVNAPDPDELFVRAADQSVVDRVLSRWGEMETGFVLEHVYEDTEPMQGARFGEVLDFAKIDRKLWPDRPARYLGVDSEVVERIGAHVRNRERGSRKREYLLDPDYQGALKSLREERAAAYPSEFRVRIPHKVVNETPNRLE